MNRKKQLFRYGRSHKIVHWGCAFDSLTELKYAISIMEEYEFLRARVTIYYHPGTKLPTDYIRECHRHYTLGISLGRKKSISFAFSVSPIIDPR